MYDQAKQSIRPELDTQAAHELPHERFQNGVLRPILKLQNELVLGLFRHYLHRRKVAYAQLSKAQRLQHIAHSIQQDNRLRGLLFGAVVGHFTQAELGVYLADEAEYNRRIAALLIQRLSSQQAELG